MRTYPGLFLRALCGVPALLFSVAAPLNAEIHECNGKWTNLPCDGEVQRTLKEAPPRAAHVTSNTGAGVEQSPPSETLLGTEAGAPSEVQKNSRLEPLAPRSDLIRKLRKANDDYRRKGGITISSSEMDVLKRLCEDRSNPFQDCFALYSQQSEKLTKLNQKKEDQNLEAERNQIERDKIRK